LRGQVTSVAFLRSCVLPSTFTFVTRIIHYE
jgi:hypothetical protein